MSVLVVGMGMPTTCTMCDLAHAMKKSDGTAQLACGVTGRWQDDYIRRPRWCPLTEVDADAAVKLTMQEWNIQEAGEFKIGDRIASILAKKGMAQRELSKLTKTTEATISRYVNNERVPSATMIVRIAKALDVSADTLLGTEGAQE